MNGIRIREKSLENCFPLGFGRIYAVAPRTTLFDLLVCWFVCFHVMVWACPRYCNYARLWPQRSCILFMLLSCAKLSGDHAFPISLVHMQHCCKPRGGHRITILAYCEMLAQGLPGLLCRGLAWSVLAGVVNRFSVLVNSNELKLFAATFFEVGCFEGEGQPSNDPISLEGYASGVVEVLVSDIHKFCSVCRIWWWLIRNENLMWNGWYWFVDLHSSWNVVLTWLHFWHLTSAYVDCQCGVANTGASFFSGSHCRRSCSGAERSSFWRAGDHGVCTLFLTLM